MSESTTTAVVEDHRLHFSDATVSVTVDGEGNVSIDIAKPWSMDITEFSFCAENFLEIVRVYEAMVTGQ